MSAVLEMRYFMPRFTMADLDAGIAPQRLPVGPMVDGVQPTAAFGPPRLQYRVRAKDYVNGQQITRWSPWATVPFVREGEDEPPTGAIVRPTSVVTTDAAASKPENPTG